MEKKIAVVSDQLTMPSLPRAVESLAYDGIRMTHEFSRAHLDPSWRPSNVSPPMRKQIEEECIPALRKYLSPMPRDRLSARVVALLGHYFVAEMPEPMLVAIVDDWVAALSEYPEWAVLRSAQQWLRSSPKKPTIADIVDACESLVSVTRAKLGALERIVASTQISSRGPANQIGTSLAVHWRGRCHAHQAD